MSVTESRLLSVRTVLFGEREVEIAGSVRERGAIGAVASTLNRLPDGIGEVALDRLGDVVANLVDLDVLEVLKRGWQKHQALQEAARRTATVPGAEEVLDLVTHRMTSTQHPRVEVFVDEVHIASLPFEIEVWLDLEAVNAVVAAGRLVALKSGAADVGAKLSCDDILIKEGSRHIDLNLSLGFDDGIELVELPPPMPPAPRSNP